MKAERKKACVDMTLRSQASAKPSPAPAATPLTAAMVGSGASTSALTIGLNRSLITEARSGPPVS